MPPEIPPVFFHRAYNGLLNVGVETQMYFKGHLRGVALSGATWSLNAPTGSQAAIGAPTVVDTSTEVVAVAQSGAVHESLPASGYSVDNLIPHAPLGVVAAVSGTDITITWEAPDDPDIDFYRVFRATQADFSDMIEVATTILSVDQSNLPTDYNLAQNYPNPFNPITTIDFALPENVSVDLKIYNAMGQVVKTLVNREMEAGRHSITINGKDLASGIYFYVLHSGDFTQTRKMVLLK